MMQHIAGALNEVSSTHISFIKQLKTAFPMSPSTQRTQTQIGKAPYILLVRAAETCVATTENQVDFVENCAASGASRMRGRDMREFDKIRLSKVYITPLM